MAQQKAGMDMNGNPMPLAKLPSPEQNMLNILKSMEPMRPQKFPFVGGIHGDMGTGKTVSGMKLLQGVVEDSMLILYIHTAAGYSTFNNHPELMNRVQRMQYERQEQLVAVAKAIRAAKKVMKETPEKANDLIKAMSKIGGVMLDEYSHMSALDQAWIVKSRATQAEESGGFKDPYAATLPDYGAQMHRSNEVIDNFMVADVHLMVICHTRYDKDTAMYRPDFPDKTAAGVYKVLHSMYFAKAERGKEGEPVRTLELRADRKFAAKNRIGGLGNRATVEEIISAYHKWGVIETATEAPKEVAVSPSPEPVVQATPEATPQAEDAIGDIESLLK